MKLLVLMLIFISFYSSANENFNRGIDAYKDKKYKEALVIFEEEADKGLGRAQYFLSKIYLDGLGVKKDTKKGFYWLDLAAKNSDKFATYKIAFFYFDGEVVTKNNQKGIMYLKESALSGVIPAQEMLGHIYSTGNLFNSWAKYDNKEALKWLHMAESATHDAETQFLIGVMYEQSKVGNKKENQLKTLSWYEKSAGQGHARAQSNLGYLYREGELVYRNYKKAFKWVYAAAMQGEWLADFSLAEMYEKGEGVELNLIEAYAWYSISLVESDAQNAKVKLDEIEALLSKKDIELAQDKVLEISKNIKGIL